MPKHCENEECKNYWSCKMLKGRFGIEECNLFRIKVINMLHEVEVNDRKIMLEGCK
jgi:hypothetical protein